MRWPRVGASGRSIIAAAGAGVSVIQRRAITSPERGLYLLGLGDKAIDRRRTPPELSTIIHPTLKSPTSSSPGPEHLQPQDRAVAAELTFGATIYPSKGKAAVVAEPTSTTSASIPTCLWESIRSSLCWYHSVCLPPTVGGSDTNSNIFVFVAFEFPSEFGKLTAKEQAFIVTETISITEPSFF